MLRKLVIGPALAISWSLAITYGQGSANRQAPSSTAPITPNSGGRPVSSTDLTKVYIDGLQNQIDLLVSQINELRHRTATFDPASPGQYQRIDTEQALFLISLGKIEPYLDGYKVELQIGNPLAATFKGFDVIATWSPRQKRYTASQVALDAGWLKKQKTKHFSFAQELISGHWNTVQLVLPETESGDFGQLIIAISVDTVSLAPAPLAK